MPSLTSSILDQVSANVGVSLEPWGAVLEPFQADLPVIAPLWKPFANGSVYYRHLSGFARPPGPS